MAHIRDWVESARLEGYSSRFAAAKVCQDIVLKAIAASDFGSHITIKGGVVMRSITGSRRRATLDLDLDFIRYSLDDDSIRRFISRLNCLDGIDIHITAPIEELSQQEYRGKRIYIVIEDESGYSLKSKIDLGVHKQMQVEQDEYCFHVCMDDKGISLLVNSKEQIFSEKLRSLLRHGPLSTRYPAENIQEGFPECQTLFFRNVITHTRRGPQIQKKAQIANIKPASPYTEMPELLIRQ